MASQEEQSVLRFRMQLDSASDQAASLHFKVRRATEDDKQGERKLLYSSEVKQAQVPGSTRWRTVELGYNALRTQLDVHDRLEELEIECYEHPHGQRESKTTSRVFKVQSLLDATRTDWEEDGGRYC
jgi:hypothetical protein